MVRILTVRTRDQLDLVTVQEKLDGSCVAVGKLNGEILPLIRAGYLATQSHYEQHHYFADWVGQNRPRFDFLLDEGERCAGEWLMEAHGTVYNLPHEPFVIFDILRKHRRTPASIVKERAERQGFVTPRVVHVGGAISIEDVVLRLDPSGHGAVGLVEGAVWRLEREGAVEYLAKYVRPQKDPGEFFSHRSGQPTIYNWRPAIFPRR